MTENILLDLNVDELFEKSYISEIVNTHQKIKRVVERKSVDLRTMVGERYRDLLKAADTITAMQATSKALLGQVENINGYCKNLNDQQLLGFKTETDTIQEIQLMKKNKQTTNYFSTMVQIKLLNSLPALIWSYLDEECYYRATELFIFSRHISAGLQLDSDNLLMRKLPIAKTQWEMIKPLQNTIKQEVMTTLKRETLRADAATDCLLAMLQLEPCSMDMALKSFLKLRCSAFANCLINEQNARIKERIIASLKILCESLNLIADCFLENNLMARKLKELTDPQVSSTIYSLTTNDINQQHIDFLPDIILNFKPKFSPKVLNQKDVLIALKEWSTDVGHLANEHLKQMIYLIQDIKIIYQMKIEASVIVKQLNFEQLTCPSYTNDVHALDFYSVYYLPLINERIHDIINDNWSKAIHQVFEAIRNEIADRQTKDAKNYTFSMWEELTTDIPNTLAEVINNEDLTSRKLLMKCKGYDTEIIRISLEFDQQLEGIIEEIDILLKEPISKQTDSLHLVEFLLQTAEKHLLDFLEKITDLSSSFCQQHHSIIFLANCCCALMELSPNLKVCYCQRSTWRQQVGLNVKQKSGQEHWQNLCEKFEKTIAVLWQQIVDDLLNEHSCEDHLPQNISHERILSDFTQWETINWEEKQQQQQQDEETSGNIIPATNMRIPLQSSISLQLYFHTLINKLNETIPQTLPTNALKYFHEKLLEQFLNYYRKLLNNLTEIVSKTQTPTQNIAIQLYFDMKYLYKLFNIQTQAKLKQQFQDLQNICKNLIDPIDFELLSTHIANNVQTAVAKTSCLFGVLLPIDGETERIKINQTTNVITAPSSTLPFKENDPNVLSLCSTNSTTIWFPLLPVVSTSNSSSKGTADSRLLSTVNDEDKNSSISKMVVNRKTENKSKIPGATSFFGSMSQDWFR